MTTVENRVLIINDDEKLQNLLKEYLEDIGFVVLARLDGLNVLKTIKMESPDMIILDIMLKLIRLSPTIF